MFAPYKVYETYMHTPFFPSRCYTAQVYDIITILSFRYRIGSEDVYLLEPLVYHLAAAVRRIDACYCTCSDMIRKSNW